MATKHINQQKKLYLQLTTAAITAVKLNCPGCCKKRPHTLLIFGLFCVEKERLPFFVLTQRNCSDISKYNVRICVLFLIILPLSYYCFGQKETHAKKL